MLLLAVAHLKRQQLEYRSLKLYGQERNLLTSAIGRRNLFLHGVEDFEIIRGDTLFVPALVEYEKLKKFDDILANPPYSIKQWNRDAWGSDPSVSLLFMLLNLLDHRSGAMKAVPCIHTNTDA